jgi:hypothetical protein
MDGGKEEVHTKQAPPDGADVSGGGRDDDGVEDDDEDRVNPIRGCLLSNDDRDCKICPLIRRVGERERKQ